MKKNFLTFITALTVVFTAANADDVNKAPVSMADNGVGEIVIDLNGRQVTGMPPMAQFATTAGDDEDVFIDYHYCGDPKTALTTGDGGDIENSAAILLPEDVVARYAGSELVSVMICSGFNRGNPWKNNITDATVFLNHDIFNEKDFFTQRGRLSKSSQTWSEITFSEPYRLEAGKPLYVGYRVIRPTTLDCPFAADKIPIESTNSFWVNYSLNGERRWENWAPQYGSLCMHVKLRGKALPVDDVENMSLTVPMQVNKGSFNASFRVRNVGANDIANIGYTCTVGEKYTVEKVYTPDTPIKFSEAIDIPVSLVCEEYGLEVPVTLTVTSVNGVEDSDPANNVQARSVICLDASMGFTRRFVMEEGTGLWCVNCPRGLGTMKYMSERYPDTFVGIGIHYRDPMQISSDKYAGHSYSEHLTMLGGYPNGRYNRNDTYGNSINDFGSHVESIYKQIVSMPAVADISAEIYFNDESKTEINVETKTQFALDTSAPFRIALVLLENNLGPYKQQNGYAGVGFDCGGWESMPNEAEYIFDEVARYIDYFNGAYSSLPEDKKAKTYYSYSSLLPTAPLKSLDDFDVVAMLINGKTGVVENAVKCHGNKDLPIKASTGVSEVPAAGTRVKVEPVEGGIKVKGNCRSVKVFHVSGVAVAETEEGNFIALPAGLYVVNADGVNHKVMVK